MSTFNAFRKRAASACACLTALAAAADEGKPFLLAEDGKPAASIVVAESPMRSAIVAAIELRDHVKKISGAELPIVPDTVAVAGPRVLVGESAATRDLGLRSDGFKSQEYLVGPRKGDLVLMGRDERKPFGVKVFGGAEMGRGEVRQGAVLRRGARPAAGGPSHASTTPRAAWRRGRAPTRE